MARGDTPRRSVPLRWILRLVATGAALGLIVWWLPAGELREAIGSIPGAAWPLALAGYLGLHVVGVFKWRGLINAAGAGLPLRASTQAYYWGLFGNLFLPSIVGGDVVRAGVAMKSADSRSAVLLGSMIDRLLDVVGLGLLAGVGALVSPRALDENSRRVFLAFVGLLAMLGLGGLAAAWLLPIPRMPWRARRILVKVRHAIRATASRPGALVQAFLLGLALQAGLVGLNWQLGVQVGIEVPAYVWLFAWPLAKIAGLTPLTQGGLGVREAALAALLAPFGVASVQAVAAGLVFAAVLVVGGLVSGGIALALRRGVATAGGGASVNSAAGPA